MIDGPAMVALLGRASDVAEVKNLVKQLGAKDPKLKRGDTAAYVVADKLGLELVFEDEAYVTKRKDLAIGEGKLFLNSITFKTAYPRRSRPTAGRFRARSLSPAPRPTSRSFSASPRSPIRISRSTGGW
jgi:hypothetical protein